MLTSQILSMGLLVIAAVLLAAHFIDIKQSGKRNG
jgi:hypothetical protein